MSHKILIIDDKELVSNNIGELLEGEENLYEVQVIRGSDIIQSLQDNIPDMVMIDFETLDSKLSENIGLLSNNRIFQEIPFVVLADYSQKSRLGDVFELGFVDFIRKPIQKEEFLMRVKTVLDRFNYLMNLKKQYEHLHELSVVARNSANSVVIMSSNGEIEWVNEGFERMYGYKLAEFKEMFAEKIFNPDENPKLLNAIEFCKRKQDSFVYENLWETKQGHTKWIQTTLTPIVNEEDEVLKYVAIESDVTDLKVAEERLAEQNDHLLSLTEHLESTNELLEKQRFEIEEQKDLLMDQKKKSDELLLNILPFETAEQLKKKGFAKSKNYRMVTVMFTDFKGFSELSNELSTQDLITELNIYFEQFDEIIEGHFIEKIKTIGDAYMCAGGLPLRNKSNPIDVTLAGLKIQKFMLNYSNVKRQKGEPIWELRLGIHTGEVIAGVIGKKKFAYDIWGDTVNTAARMQESGEVGKVNISEETYEYIKDYFDCTYRGKIALKHKGETDMYFVNRLKPEYSEDEDGFIPNHTFNKILAKY